MDVRAPRQPYPSDLTDEEWAIIGPELPAPVPAGAPRTTDLREVVNAILYRLHNGCAWRVLSHDFPPEGAIREYFHRWRRAGLWAKLNDTLRRRVRRVEGRAEEPSAGLVPPRQSGRKPTRFKAPKPQM
jgi:putative transposase